MPAALDSPAAVRRAAMDLLARREHGRVELARKLRRRGASAELIEAALDRLAAEGLLSESRYLESFIASRAGAGFGPLRIRAELLERGLARAQIDAALAQAGIDWNAQMRDLWRRRFAGERPRDAREQGRQGRFLACRGYPLEAIGRLLKGAAED